MKSIESNYSWKRALCLYKTAFFLFDNRAHLDNPEGQVEVESH